MKLIKTLKNNIVSGVDMYERTILFLKIEKIFDKIDHIGRKYSSPFWIPIFIPVLIFIVLFGTILIIPFLFKCLTIKKGNLVKFNTNYPYTENVSDKIGIVIKTPSFKEDFDFKVLCESKEFYLSTSCELTKFKFI